MQTKEERIESKDGKQLMKTHQKTIIKNILDQIPSNLNRNPIEALLNAGK